MITKKIPRTSSSFLIIFLLALQTIEGAEVDYEYISSDSIPELKYLDETVDPCDDFYAYACGNFAEHNPKPADQQIWDHFTILQDEVHALMRQVLESPRRPSEPLALQKAKAAYSACADTTYADLLATPQRAVLERVGNWPLLTSPTSASVQGQEDELTFDEVGEIVAEYGVPLFFNFQVLPNYHNAETNMIYIYRDKLSNPQTYYPRFQQDLEDYLSIDANTFQKANSNERTVSPFENFLRTMAFRMRNLMGTWRSDDDIKAEISETISFMRILQGGGISNPEMPSTVSFPTVKELQDWTDEQFGDKSINWKSYLSKLFARSGVKIEDDMMIMHTPSLTYGVLALFLQTDTRTLRNLVMTRLFTYMAPDGDKEMREAFDEYYTKQGYDVFPRWQYCLRKITGYPDGIEYAMALTYEYQRYHFNVNKLSSAADMVQDLMAAFEDMLNEAEWIDDETRVSALKKLDYMLVLLGFPEYAEDRDLLDEYYDDLRVCTWEHFGNSQRARSFSQAKNFALIGERRNREIWNLSPLEVNAFYNRANNRILFPVSVLNPIFFGGNISTIDYGRIGAVIGHEITHGYDKEGKLYNEEGLLKSWWTEDTEKQFSEKTECFLNQYANYYIEEIGQYVNASKTLNENIADNGGLRQAYRALQKLKKKSHSVKTVEGFTMDQLFFIGYGTMWCMTESDYYLQYMHESGVHAPGRFRVIGTVSNMDEFAEAFQCPKGSPMNPEKKCVLW